MKKRFLVIGLGRFGVSLAETLYAEGGEVIAVDERSVHVEEIKDRVSHAVQLDGTDIDALKSVGADGVDAAFIAIGENLEASVITTVVLKELGLKEIIVRAYTEREKRILEMVGASRVIFVEQEMGRRLAKACSGNAILDYIELSTSHSLVQWEVTEALVGSSLADLDVLGKWGLNLFAIKKRGGTDGTFNWRKEKEQLNFVPPPDYVLETGDILILVGKNKDLTRFTEQKKSPFKGFGQKK
ncbi:MAG: potassium channel family protein [Nitrospiria bacterium]